MHPPRPHSAAAAGPATSGGGAPATRARWRLVGALALTQTIGYGVLYYAYAIFLTPPAPPVCACSPRPRC